jgi:hypothetical protein
VAAAVAAAARWGCGEGWGEGGVWSLPQTHTHRCAVAGCLEGRGGGGLAGFLKASCNRVV